MPKTGTWSFQVHYAGSHPTAELSFEGRVPNYHYAFLCPKCGDVWARQIYTRLLHLRFWPIPTPCPAHGGKGWLGAPINAFNGPRQYLPQLRGRDLQREFMHLTKDYNHD